MYIVRLLDGTRHSAWNTKQEAEHQLEVLDGKGSIYFDETTQAENGHYFV